MTLTFAKQILQSEAISLGEAKFHSPQANFVEKREQVFRLALFFLGRVDKKDATLKMAKLLIYQGFTALFRLFFKVFFVLVLPLVKNKELTKKMPFPTKELTKKMPLFLAVFFAYTVPKNAP